MGELLRIEKWAENLEEVTIGRWLKAEGDAVEAGEPICEIITEKVTFEYESPLTGTLRRIYAPEKSVVPVGYVIGFVAAGDEEPPADIEERNRQLLESHQAQVRLELDFQAAAPEPQKQGKRVRAVPAARRLARMHGISVADVAAALGIDDRPVTAEDVQKYLDERR